MSATRSRGTRPPPVRTPRVPRPDPALAKGRFFPAGRKPPKCPHHHRDSPRAPPVFTHRAGADQKIRLAPGGGVGSLTVTDNRTGKRYELPVTEDGFVSATAFKAIKAGGDGNGLKLYDPGYMNTAPCKSKISYIDGDKGILRYRGYPIEELAERSTYLEVSHPPTKQGTQPPILLLLLLLRSPTKNRHRSPPIPLTRTSSLNTVRVRARLRRPPRRTPAPRVGGDRHAPLRAPSPGHRRHRSSAPRRAPHGSYPRGSQRPLHFSPRAEPGVARRGNLRQPRRPGQADRAYHR